MKYCIECGKELINKELIGEGIISYCPCCNQYRFPIYNVAVSMIVINKSNNKILLIKQYNKDFYILVAGYVSRGEKVEDTVARELMEETGMKPASIKFNRTEFYESSNTLMINFTVFVENDNNLHTNNEIDSYNWFTKEEAINNIKPNSLASKFLNAYLNE